MTWPQVLSSVATAAVVGVLIALWYARRLRRHECRRRIEIRVEGHAGTLMQMSCYQIRLWHRYGALDREDGWATLETFATSAGLILLQARPEPDR